PRVAADRLTLGDALARYRDEITPSKKGAVVERYRIARWLKHPFAQRSLSGLRGMDFAGYRDQRLAEGVSPATVRQELALVSNVYTRCAKEWGLEGLANPVAATALPKTSKGRERWLRPGEEVVLLEAAAKIDARLPGLIRFALETAMRRGEIAGIQPHDIDLDAKTVTLRDTKNGETRTVPLSSRAVVTLPPEGFGMTLERISRAFREACDLAGIDGLHFHDLRHEATSRLFELGKLNVIEIAMITGHKDLHMLRRYTHLNARQLADRLG
ncbi:MAG: tyrosine-type recombinase/integrase, partial [Pseudomonadota bacterium]